MAVPQLGAGREAQLRPLLDVLPLQQLLAAVATHVAQLPAAIESPLRPFVLQPGALGDG